MLLKITQHCSMNCTHCMNNATPNNRHMSEKTLHDALDFLIRNNACKSIILSGGEPTEHPDFVHFMQIITDTLTEHVFQSFVTITTNGFWCLDNPELAKSIVRTNPNIQIQWQVSTDSRYYPKELPVHKKLWREPGFVLCTDCVDALYPQGRAVSNNLSWTAMASKCFNVRAIAKQLSNPTVENIVDTLFSRMKFCTPAINYDGSIRLGESDLCPICTSIYDSSDEIVRKIKEFKCHGCDHINNSLPDLYKQFL